MILLLCLLCFVYPLYALVAQSDSCQFGINAAGSDGNQSPIAEWILGQLPDGQNCAHGDLQPATYYIDSSAGLITDSSGRGCILTTQTTQFQCDNSASPTPNFSISYAGSPSFFQCPTGRNGSTNIYTEPPPGQGGCSSIALSATSCASSCPAAPPPPSITPTPFIPEPKAVQSCPLGLTLGFQYPHLIVPISQASPDTAAGSVYSPSVNPGTSSIFVFDIPNSYAGKACSFQFFLPQSGDLRTSSYSLVGSGTIDVAQLAGNADLGTTWNNASAVGTDYGVTVVEPGRSYVIATFSCPANTEVSFSVVARQDTELLFFQDYNQPA